MESNGDGDENASVIDKASTLIDSLSGSTTAIIAKFKNVLNRFIEATAVMIVTSCLIPLLVILFFVWLVKTLFGAQIVLPRGPRPFQRGSRDGEAEEKADAV